MNNQSRNARRAELIRVRQVHPLENLRAHFVFTDGSERDIDLEQYLHGPVFEPIRNDPELFRNMFVEGGTITWPGEVDIDPDTLYYGDEDPPWVKYDKEQQARRQRTKRVSPVKAARVSANGRRKTTQARAPKKRTAKARPSKVVAAKTAAEKKK